jgi:succinyl-CoA synthetase alpha subunit
LSVKTLIKPSEYHDSVSLMLAAKEVAKLAGIQDAAVVMATEANKGILKEAGMLTEEALAATPNDLVIAVSGDAAALDVALAQAEKLLQAKAAAGGGGGAAYAPKTMRAAVKSHPAANVAIVSVAGRFAADEAWEALRHGLHVLLFSDNVSLEDEIALKRYAVEHGLLLMGPGAGTAIINGAALAFANVIPHGPVGIVSAAGTGLQEVSTLLAKHGVGITQGIGTGGRDLKEAVGGLMFLQGLEALQHDPDTQVIVLVSKPPAPSVTAKVLAQAQCSEKPTVVCLLGAVTPPQAAGRNLHFAHTLEQAAYIAAGLALHAEPPAPPDPPLPQPPNGLRPAQNGCIRALFSGGTLCYEAQVIWQDVEIAPVMSNAPLRHDLQLADSNHSQGHSAIDLGEEEFTVGRPHPMIDNDLRMRRMLQEARDPATGVLLLDVVIGYGAHPDPAAELGGAIRQAQEIAARDGRWLPVIASVTGTEQDPQGLKRTTAMLEAAGAVVCPSNAAAARMAAALVEANA